MFGNIFGVSGSQLLILVAIGLVVAAMATWYRPLLFASIDPEAAEARGVPVRRLGLMFLVVLALTVTGAAQVVGTLLVLSLAITPAAAAQRLSASPLVVAVLSVVFAVASLDRCPPLRYRAPRPAEAPGDIPWSALPGLGTLLPQLLQLPADPGHLVLEVFEVVLEIPGAPAAPCIRQVGPAAGRTRSPGHDRSTSGARGGNHDSST